MHVLRNAFLLAWLGLLLLGVTPVATAQQPEATDDEITEPATPPVTGEAAPTPEDGNGDEVDNEDDAEPATDAEANSEPEPEPEPPAAEPEPEPAEEATPIDPAPTPPPPEKATPSAIASDELEGAEGDDGENEVEDEDDDGPSLSIGIGMRTGLAMTLDPPEGGGAQLSLNDGLVDQVHLRPYFAGQLTEHIGFSANFEVGTGSEGSLPSFSVLDAILQVKIIDELQVWIGQMIPAADRSNTNGPFYHNSWNFPITLQTYPFDVSARDRGLTVWGMLADGVLQYHVSAVDLQPGAAIEHARYSGRISLQLLEPEAFYYTSGTYYGEKDVLAIAAVGHVQQGVDGVDEDTGDPLDNDFLGFSFDLLFEKNFGSAGTFTLEGGYKNFEETGEDYVVNQGSINAEAGVVGPIPGSSYLVGVSWLTPEKIGIGKIQPNARMQIGDYGDDTVRTFDAGIGYIIDGFDHKWHLNYRNTNLRGEPENILQIGAQVQMWN